MLKSALLEVGVGVPVRVPRPRREGGIDIPVRVPVVASVAVLALLGASAHAAMQRQTATSGSWRAVLAYEQHSADSSQPRFSNLRIAVRHGGRLVFAQPISVPGRVPYVQPVSLHFRDLDGNGSPELLLDLLCSYAERLNCHRQSLGCG